MTPNSSTGTSRPINLFWSLLGGIGLFALLVAAALFLQWRGSVYVMSCLVPLGGFIYGLTFVRTNPTKAALLVFMAIGAAAAFWALISHIPQY